jgi:hypothetical protein
MSKREKANPFLINALLDTLDSEKAGFDEAVIALVGTVRLMMGHGYTLPQEEIIVTVTHETKTSQDILLVAGGPDLNNCQF